MSDLKPPRALTCCTCGERTRGRQWWNRDRGFGVCVRCADDHARHLRERWLEAEADVQAELRDLYGERGVHWDVDARPVPVDKGTVPG